MRGTTQRAARTWKPLDSRSDGEVKNITGIGKKMQIDNSCENRAAQGVSFVVRCMARR